MKRVFRTRSVQETLAVVFALYLRFALGTMRWTQEGLGEAEAVWAEGGGVLVCFWHGLIALSPACWPLDRAQEPRALISLSPDGQFIAGAVGRLGFPAIRGSSAKTADAAKAKGGAGAFRDVLKWLSRGGGVAVTPDGPRGPAETMSEGVPLLACASGAKILLVGLAAKPCLRLKSWDAAIVPLPFARGAIAWERLSSPPRRLSDAELGELRHTLGEGLSRVTRRAEAMLG